MRKIALLLGILFLAYTVKAEDNGVPNDLAAWASSFPEEIEGIKIYTPVEDDGNIHISDIVDFNARSRENIFINSLYDLQFNLDQTNEQIERIDYSGRRMSIHRKSIDNSKGYTYNYTIAFQTADDMLSFIVYDISISYREKGIVPRTQKIEKLNVSGNRKYFDMVEACLFDISKFIARVSDAVLQNTASEVTFWADLENKTVVKGMNPTEVILIKGRPSNIRKTGLREKWMYGNDNVIIFNEGVVTTIIG